jgi:hypothetical protein
MIGQGARSAKDHRALSRRILDGIIAWLRLLRSRDLTFR